eukprot:TRINITY_DN64648_c0_g1_i1.p1 TRINITY_DN64648_c0_g1~~TRINITY_DN64648_c0_g1_i1.p1  ORF type:complete len:535 (-),score=83.09 TRINITY_DN64648_c0_g1_i1:106-1710(-)
MALPTRSSDRPGWAGRQPGYYAEDFGYVQPSHMPGMRWEGSGMATGAESWDQFQPGQPMQSAWSPILSTAPTVRSPPLAHPAPELHGRPCMPPAWVQQRGRDFPAPPFEAASSSTAFAQQPLAPPRASPKVRSSSRNKDPEPRNAREWLSDGEEGESPQVLCHGQGGAPTIVISAAPDEPSSDNMLNEAVARFRGQEAARDLQDASGKDSQALRIRNTFIEQRLVRSPSLEPFFQERKVKSEATSPRLERSEAATRPYEAEDILPSAGGLGSAIFDSSPLLGAGGPGSAIFETPTASISEAMLGSLSAGHTGPQTSWMHGYQHPAMQVHPMPTMAIGQQQSDPTSAERLDRHLMDLIEEFNAGGTSNILHHDFLTETTGGSSASNSASAIRGPSAGWCGESISTAHSNSNTGSGEMPAENKPSSFGQAQRPTDKDKPALGSPELPSRGSALHRWAACKPCAFVFADGCQNGVECQFCHLCDPGEKKRRKKERSALKKEAKDDRRGMQDEYSARLRPRENVPLPRLQQNRMMRPP